MKLWQVQATKTEDTMERDNAWFSDKMIIVSRTRQLPTFYLDPNVQGLVNEEQVKRVAEELCGPGCEFIVSEVGTL